MDYPGEVLGRGSTGEAVIAVQAALGVQRTGVFGPTTEGCVAAFQRSVGLKADGVVGPRTWAALFAGARTGTDLGRAALEIARGRVGVREEPLGSNSGPEVDRYLMRVGLAPGNPWCIAFVFDCVADAAGKLGIRNPLVRTGSASVLFFHARRYRMLVPRPQPGDIFLCIGGDTGHYHGGFVAGPIRAERFPTVEGNSNDDGSANGTEVVARKPGRRLSTCHYVRL